MSLVSNTVEIAAAISKKQAHFKLNVGAPAQQIIDLISKAEDKQGVLDIIDTPAAQIQFVNDYSAFMALRGFSIPTIDTTVFQPQEDGTVIYVAPPEPEPEPEVEDKPTPDFLP